MKKIATAVLAVSLMIGCAGLTKFVSERPSLSKATMQILTIQYLKQFPERVEPMQKNLAMAKHMIQQGTVATIDELADGVINSVLKDDSLMPEEAMILKSFSDALREEGKSILLAQGFDPEFITEENKPTLYLLIDASVEAAKLMQARL